MKPSSFLIAVSILQLAAVSPALAQATQAGALPVAEAPSERDVEVARTHFGRGVQFYNNGDYKLSLLEFRRSYELSRNYRVLYNIGQVNQQLSNYAKALAALEQYLKEGGAEVDEERRVEVASSVAELEKKTAVLKLAFDVDIAEVWIDDVALGTFARGALVRVDAGDHRIEVRRAGRESAGAAVSLAAGDATTVELRLPERRLRPPELAPAPVAVSPPKSSTLLWVGWIATGTLAAGAGITGVLATSHASELASLRNSPDSTASERQSEGDQARAFAIASDALAGTAVAVGLTSLYFTVFSKDKSPGPRRESATNIRLGPSGVSLVHRY